MTSNPTVPQNNAPSVAEGLNMYTDSCNILHLIRDSDLYSPCDLCLRVYMYQAAIFDTSLYLRNKTRLL